MDIALAASSGEFIANPAAVAGHALIDRIGLGVEHMSVDEAGADILWPADVAGTATGMTGSAVALTAMVDLFPGVITGPLLEKSWKGR